VAVVRFLIDVNGAPVPGTVLVEDSEHSGFAAPAMQVVETMRFQPARVNGRRVAVWVVLPVQFSLRR
jgi:TonB family protein